MNDHQTEELAQLDEILDDLSKPAEAQCNLLREHLESARVSLVGSMPTEYALNLEMAQQSLSCVSGQDLRARIQDFIHTVCAPHEGRPHARKEDA